MIPLALVSQTLLRSAQAISFVSNMQGERAALMGQNVNLVLGRRMVAVIKTLNIVFDSSFTEFSRAVPLMKALYSGIIGYAIFKPDEPPIEKTSNLSGRMKPINEAIGLLAKLAPTLLIVHAIASVILLQSIPETAFLVCFTLSWCHLHGYFPSALHLPYQRLATMMDNVALLLSYNIMDKFEGMTSLISQTGIFNQKRVFLEDAKLPDHLKDITSDRCKKIVDSVDMGELTVSFDHFAVDPLPLILDKTGQHILEVFDRFFAERWFRIDELVEKTMKHKDWEKAKEADPSLEPFAFARKLLSDLIEGIQNAKLPTGEGLDYTHIQYCERILNERLPLIDYESEEGEALLMGTFNELIIYTAGFCADGPFHQVPAAAINVSYKVSLPNQKEADPALEASRKIFLKLQENRLLMAVSAVAEASKRKDIIGVMLHQLFKGMGEENDLHRNNDYLRTLFSHAGFHHHDQSVDKHTLGGSAFVNYLYWWSIGKPLLKWVYTPENIIEGMIAQKNSFKTDLWVWASEHPTILLIAGKDVDFENWVQYGCVKVLEKWNSAPTRAKYAKTKEEKALAQKDLAAKEEAENAQLRFLLSLFLVSKGVFVANSSNALQPQEDLIENQER